MPTDEQTDQQIDQGTGERTDNRTANRTANRTGLRTDLLWRSLPAVAALACLAFGAPRGVSGGLALAAAVLAVERMVALRRSTLGDRVLVGVGGLLVAVVLTGICLDLVGIRLRPASWVVSLAVLSVIGLVIAGSLAERPQRGDATRSTDAPRDAGGAAATARANRRTALRAAPWLVIAAVVTAVAVHASASSLKASDEPPLQMSFGRVSGNDVQVVVTSTDAIGPLELRTSAGDDDVSYPLFDVGRDGEVTTTVSLPTTGRYVITVSYPDQSEPLRTLILDR